MGRTPLHSLCLGMNDDLPTDSAPWRNHVTCMAALLDRDPCLVLYTDADGRTPMQYVSVGRTTAVAVIVDLLRRKRVAESAAEAIRERTREAQSGRRPSAMETVDRVVNLSGLDAAIMEAGFNV